LLPVAKQRSLTTWSSAWAVLAVLLAHPDTSAAQTEKQINVDFMMDSKTNFGVV
jgi:hypothetical protein